MTSRPSPDLVRLFVAIQQFAETIYPGHRGAELIIHLADGRTGSIPVPPCACAAGAGPDDSDAGLSEMERDIRQVFREAAEGEVLAREEIARRVGCETTTRLAEALGRLVRLGKLVNRRPGYCRP